MTGYEFLQSSYQADREKGDMTFDEWLAETKQRCPSSSHLVNMESPCFGMRDCKKCWDNALESEVE